MRPPVDRERILDTLRRLAQRCRGEGRVYVVGGTSAVVEGWRASTVDIDLVLDPEPRGAFEAIRDLKRERQVNIELASPADFVPALPGWQDRSTWLDRVGGVDLLHYDFYGQALSKLARDHEKDRADVRAMVDRGLVDPDRLVELFERARDRLLRYPALDEDTLRSRVLALAQGEE